VFCSGPLKHADLVAQDQILELHAARERRIEGKTARSVVRKTRISENQEARISHIRSDFSRFSGATVRRPEMSRGVQAATRESQNRVEAQAPESAVIVRARRKPVEGGFPGLP
jgi:hypothetical protein